MSIDMPPTGGGSMNCGRRLPANGESEGRHVLRHASHDKAKKRPRMRPYVGKRCLFIHAVVDQVIHY